MVVYLAGKITGDDNYKAKFEKAAQALEELGATVLSPAMLPAGLTNEQYMRIDLAMIDSAERVYFLQDFATSAGATAEFDYCTYVKKPIRMLFNAQIDGTAEIIIND